MKQPLVAPLVALAAGIGAARLSPFTFWETLLSISLLAGLALASLRLGAPFAGVAACLSAFALTGALLASLPEPGDPSGDPLLITTVLERENANLDDPIRLCGFVRVPPADLGDADRFVLEVESLFHRTLARGGVRVTVNRSPPTPPLRLRYGQRVEFLAHLRLPRNFENPGAFDWTAYLRRQRIFLTATVRPGVPLLAAPGAGGSRAQSWLWSLRLSARDRLTRICTRLGLPGPMHTGEADPGARAPEMLQALLLGDPNSLDRQTTLDFQKTGLYHVLVVSGLHVGLLAFALLRFLRLICLSPRLASGITVLLVTLYALLASAGVPVLRATWMLAAYLLATLVFRRRQALNAIAGAALCFLVADPGLLFDPGFQLSFLAVALIAGVAMPVLETTLEPLRLALRDIWNTDRDLHLAPAVAVHRIAIRSWLEPLVVICGLHRRWVTGPCMAVLRLSVWGAELAWVSLVVQAGLALPLATYFQRVSGSAVVGNLVIIPLVWLAVPTGLLALLTSWTPAAVVSVWAAGAITRVVSWQAAQGPWDVRVPPPPFWLGTLFAFCLVTLSWSFSRGRRAQSAAGAAFLLVLAGLVLHPFPPAFEKGSLELSAIDVGQGEALLLVLPQGQAILVDAGGQPDFRDPDQPRSRREPIDIGEVVVSPYLWSRSIRKLDAVAVTHPDADHLGGVPAVLRNFEVGELWLSREQSTGAYRDVIALARSRGTLVRWLAAGESLSFDRVLIQVLGLPRSETYSKNNQSMVLRLCYGRHSFLLAADIELQREIDLVDSGLVSPSDILKVAHHGSRTSSREVFLELARPSFGIVSAGADNFYGHPHQEVLERFSRRHIAILRTDQEGLITVTSDGWRLALDTFKRRSRSREAELRRIP